MMSIIDLTQRFGRLIPLKQDRGMFNVLTYETEYAMCVKWFNRNDVSTNRCSQITVLNLTRQDGDDAEAMLLRLFAEDWDNNIGSAPFSKGKLSIYLTYCLKHSN